MNTPILIFALLCVSSTFALNPKDVEELYECDEFPKEYEKSVQPYVDTYWTDSVPYFYIPFWSKGFMYRIAKDYFTPEDFSKLTLADMDQTCFFYSFIGKDVPVYLFGKVNTYNSYRDPIRGAIRYFTTPNGTAENPVQYAATGYTTKTDNKTYYVSMNTFAEGIKNFIVGVTVPVLPEETLKEIKTHVIANGFNPEYFATQDYSNCTPPPALVQKKN